ncbi:MAG: eight-cysteine-cluster domain-containing protein [Candidatus Aenigmarchaeota archaeon]|nr:eight-cysteine-cluster domain-containing protein [Candidatus Aenigmarchaeota archaeon]
MSKHISTNKKLLFGVLAIVIVVVVVHHYFSSRCYLRPFSQLPWIFQVQEVSLYDHGKFRSLNDLEGIMDELVSVVQKLNLQAKCAFSEERINQLRQNGKVVEIVFKKPINITISQWIEPEERYYIPTDKEGHRILTNVKSVVFILEGYMEGNVLIGVESDNVKSYECWAIKKPFSNEIDKSWIKEVETVIEGLNYKVEECSVGFEPEEVIDYDEKTKTLIAYVTVNCCGVNITVEREDLAYRIVEKQYGELCRCMCRRKITIFNVPENSKVVFIDKDGRKIVLSPNLGFCGRSTYGKCNSDEDCITDGCSSQVCRSRFEEPIGTTCEWFDCYDANKYGVACKCVDGKCQWVRK